MALKPIHDPGRGVLRTVCLMSGSGTNILRILEHRDRLARKEGKPIFEVAVIFTDRLDSKATEIGRAYDLPVVTRDLPGWLKRNGVERCDLAAREEFDRETVDALRRFKAKTALYGGYMSIASPTLIEAYTGVNVHPSDLSIKTPDGGRRFVGAHAVRDAIAAGERTIRSSTHLVIEEVDMGPLLMISKPLTVEVPQGADLENPEVLDRVTDRNQERLKEAGDWEIFPRTVEAIARGDFKRDKNGGLYYRNEPVPDGWRL